ncbi:MAG: type II toxin-antitoxin system RelE/ParE family toxin [Stenotrophomonas rhizophila]|jgi:putative addiction module killer protein|uniref:type II toxin-antitoxin system RelE/ParE family toxin n=1 Tax=Stenotrophomonas rhizophila TaxID=216778 RepID=UPI002A6A42AF|nr:type II toxin-antitoxin system RelE/ParE family toxin [Stenotrophomonas rhizophila]MDY0953477.1 type II toxin-antitoxin system RelE/ParE family toxin [Stenotrophomonas rhizophila]
MTSVRATEDFDRWLRRLRDTRARAFIAERIQRLAHGLAGDVKPVGGHVSELRIHHGPGYRVYFTRRGRQLIILLCAGSKDSQASDIKKAQRIADQL